jgi:hypothetical protein
MRSLNPILNYLLECRYQAKLILEQVPLSAIRQAVSNERQALRLATEVETIGNEASQLGPYKFNAAKIKPTLIELENIPANTLFNSRQGSVIETELNNSINQLTSKSPTPKTAKDLYIEIRTSRPELFNNHHNDEISNKLYDMVLAKTDEVASNPPPKPIIIPDQPDPEQLPNVPPFRPIPIEVPPAPSPYKPPSIPETKPETNTSSAEKTLPLGQLSLMTLAVPLAQTDAALRRPSEPTNSRLRIPYQNNQNNVNQYPEEEDNMITVSGNVDNIDDVDLEMNKILGKYSGNYRIQ